MLEKRRIKEYTRWERTKLLRRARIGDMSAVAILQRINEDKRAARGVNVDWSNPGEVKDYKSERRLTKRQLLLDKHVPDRTCPCCGEVKPNPKCWVALELYQFSGAANEMATRARENAVDGVVVVCRACRTSWL